MVLGPVIPDEQHRPPFLTRPRPRPAAGSRLRRSNGQVLTNPGPGHDIPAAVTPAHDRRAHGLPQDLQGQMRRVLTRRPLPDRSCTNQDRQNPLDECASAGWQVPRCASRCALGPRVTSWRRPQRRVAPLAARAASAGPARGTVVLVVVVVGVLVLVWQWRRLARRVPRRGQRHRHVQPGRHHSAAGHGESAPRPRVLPSSPSTPSSRNW